jgi:PAS domain S-box-containing protein
MKLKNTKFIASKNMLLYALIAIFVVLTLSHVTIIQNVKDNNKQLKNEMNQLYQENSFSFIITDNGKFRNSNVSFQQLTSRINNTELQDKLATHEKFQFTFSSEGIDYNVLMTPVPSQKSSEFLYVGRALPIDTGQQHQANQLFLWILFILELIIIGFILMYMWRRLIQPANTFRDIFRQIANGSINTSQKLKTGIKGVWGDMAMSLNRFTDHYTDKIRFASELAHGNHDATINQESDDDQLSQALLHIRDSLKNADEEAEKLKIEEEKRRWVNEGIAKFEELLRKNNDNLENLSFSILSNLVQYLDASQGGLFMLNDNDPEDIFYELKAAYAFNRKKYMDQTVRPGEGLVGTCAIEGEYIYMTDIPQDYIRITSGLGDANPDSLLLVPLKTDEKIEGVIEIASFNRLETYQIEFVEKVAESIASTISSVKINLKTNQLLKKSQQQAEELSSQEEEMRQNMEEMQATQEELSRKMKANEEMHQELLKEKALLDALMNNLPDYIYFKDKESKFIRVSKSMLPLFPVDTIEEMIGKSDFDFHQQDAAREMYEEEQEIMRKEEGFEDKVQHEVTETGKDQWVSVTKLPLYNPEGELMGTFGISKDITRFKELEFEAKKKNKDKGSGNSND